jgi:WD40 repeat protein
MGWVALCDVNGRKVATLPTEHTEFIQSIAFSSDGRWLATGGSDERVVLWDLDQRKGSLSATDDLINVMSVAFSANGQALYVGGWDSNLRLWEFTRPNEMLPLRGHSAGVDAIAISPGGTVLASAGRDGTARLWNLQANEAASHALPAEFSTLLHSEDTTGPDPGIVGVRGVALSPDESRVVAVANTKLWLFDLATGLTLATASAEEVFRRTNTFFGTMATAAFSSDGRTLAASSDEAPVYHRPHVETPKQPVIEAGNVFLPTQWVDAMEPMKGTVIPRWVQEFIHEWAHFPKGTHDDQVDAGTQALLRLMPGGWAHQGNAHEEGLVDNEEPPNPVEEIRKGVKRWSKDRIEAYEEGMAIRDEEAIMCMTGSEDGVF